MTAFSRSLTIAAGAGIAGLCLGLVIGDAPSASRADAGAEAGAYVVVISHSHSRPDIVDALTALFEDHGATQVAVTAEAPDHHSPNPHTVVVSGWPDMASAEAALRDPDYRALTSAAGLEGESPVNVLVAPVFTREPAR